MIFQNFGFNRVLLAEGGATPLDPELKIYVDAGNASSYPGSGTTWYDLTTNGNNLTLNGSPTYDATTGSFYFPNSTSVYANNTALSNTNAGTGNLTTEIWERYKGPVDNNYYYTYEWGQMDGSNYDLGGISSAYGDSGLNGYMLYERVGGIKLQYIIPAFGDTPISYTKSTDAGIWRQVVVTRASGGNVEMYVNGSLYKTINNLYSGTINQYDKIYIGSNNPSNPFGGQLPFYGDIAVFKLWSGKVLTSTEITANWNASKARFGY